MKIECVQICVNYSDYLAATLPHNKYVFDRMVVVTSHDDKDTHHVCEVNHIECVRTNVFDKEFHKAKGINLGLNKLSRSDWIVHMDSDIVLPARARYILEIAKLREDTLYGCHRAMCPSYEEWCKYLSRPVKHYECDIYIHNKWPWPLGTQIARLRNNPNDPYDLGYVPIGYFQMWNEVNGKHMNYPENHTGAARTDMGFAYQWERRFRGIIPELTVIHLSTPDQQKAMGVNWNGRATARFGPEPF